MRGEKANNDHADFNTGQIRLVTNDGVASNFASAYPKKSKLNKMIKMIKVIKMIIKMIIKIKNDNKNDKNR